MMKRNVVILSIVISAFILTLMLAGCSPQKPTATDLKITNISDETVLSHEKLMPLESETPLANPYYRLGTHEKKSVYWVKPTDKEEIPLPVNDTIIYLADYGDSFLEKVQFNYEADGSIVEATQYQITVCNQ